MTTLREGDIRELAWSVTRARGSGEWLLTSPQRRILTGARALVAGFDWAAAAWDAATGEIAATFDTTVAALSAPGDYLVQVRFTIGAERYVAERLVRLRESGP
jgi:hypothetical protein